MKIMDMYDLHFQNDSDTNIRFCITNKRDLTQCQLFEDKWAFLVDKNEEFVFKHEFSSKDDIVTLTNGDEVSNIKLDDWEFDAVSYEDYKNKWKIKLINEIDDAVFMADVKTVITDVEKYINYIHADNPLKRKINVRIADNANYPEFIEDNKLAKDILGEYNPRTKEITLYRNTILSCVEHLQLNGLTYQLIAMVLVHEIEHAYQDLTLYESFHSLISLPKFEPNDATTIKDATECFAEGAAYRYLMCNGYYQLADKWMNMRKKDLDSKYTTLNGDGKAPYWTMNRNSWREFLNGCNGDYSPKATFVY